MAKAKKLRQKVPEHVKDAILGGLREPQLAEISAHFFTAAGGTRAVAQILWEEFNQAKPGSLMRHRILDLVLKSTKFANERSGMRDDLGLLDEADLRRELAKLSLEVKDPETEDVEEGPHSTAAPRRPRGRTASVPEGEEAAAASTSQRPDDQEARAASQPAGTPPQ